MKRSKKVVFRQRYHKSILLTNSLTSGNDGFHGERRAIGPWINVSVDGHDHGSRLTSVAAKLLDNTGRKDSASGQPESNECWERCVYQELSRNDGFHGEWREAVA